MTEELVTRVLGPVVTVFVGVLVWSLKRNVRAQDDILKAIARDMAELAGRTGAHATSLAVGNEKFRQLEGRVGGLEERERSRLEAAEPRHFHRRHDDPAEPAP